MAIGAQFGRRQTSKECNLRSCWMRQLICRREPSQYRMKQDESYIECDIILNMQQAISFVNVINKYEYYCYIHLFTNMVTLCISLNLCISYDDDSSDNLIYDDLSIYYQQMIKYLINSRRFLYSQFKLEDYARQDYQTMCGLLQEKYIINNQQIQTSGLIKLLDDTNKVIGVYTASEARKKARALGIDMVLVNMASSPIICKAADFRGHILNRFYEEIVLKQQNKQISKANTTKNLKLSASLNPNQLAVKIKQLHQLTQKNLKVKQSNKEECLSKLQSLKSTLLNRCYIQQEISNKRYESDQADEEEASLSGHKTFTYSFVIKAKESNLIKKAYQEKQLEHNSAIKSFLKKYYQQDDGEMMDLRSTGMFAIQDGLQAIKQKLQAKKDVQFQSRRRQEDQIDPQELKEVEARILNKRLKKLLQFYR